MLKKITTFTIALSFVFSGTSFVIATETAVPTLYASAVNSITLTGDGDKINWEIDGYSSGGFKVVWSKKSGPTYPLRDGDKYHYFTEPNKTSDVLTSFEGDGTYFVRVCEYLGGKCGIYSNEIEVALGSVEKPCTKEYVPVCGKIQIQCITAPCDPIYKTYTNKCLMENAGATYVSAGECKEKEGNISKIILKMDENKAIWEADGYSKSGYKVVWSKNENPTYPTRTGDKYNYHSDPSSYYSKLAAFDGPGIYYVRVCEYLGNGVCDVYSNQEKVEFEAVACTMEYAPICGVDGETYSNECMANAVGVGKAYLGECKKDQQIKDIEEKAGLLSDNKLDAILTELKQLRNQVQEQQNEIKYLRGLFEEISMVSEEMQSSINNFITYGVDDNTMKLGEGERAAVMYSYKNAFYKLPQTEDELADAIKIANGRWPSTRSEEAEDNARERFRDVYLRYPNADNVNDNAAVTIIAYGLRQKAENRKLESEKAGIEIFRDIFGKNPESTEEWNIMQAITYSGSKR